MIILALDVGTSSVRAALFDGLGQRLADTTTRQEWTLTTDAHGRADFPAADMAAAVESCLFATAARATGPIAAVGMSCFWHSLIGCSARGTALTAVITWADSRGQDEARALRRRHDERAVHARTGCMLRTSFWPAKLRWLKRSDPLLFKRCARFLSPAEWLYRRWTGSERVAHGMATATGCYDPQCQDWDDAMLALSHLDRSRVAPLGDQALTCTPEIASRCPALSHAQWFPAIGDGAANNLGAGAVGPGLAAINFGTSGAIRIVRSQGRARAPFGLFCYRIDRRRFLIGGAISNAGGLREWCVNTLRLPDDAAIEAALAQRPTPEPGLSVLPFWLAERAPSWRDDLSGAIVGLRQSTTPLDLLQAITEATYQRLATIADRVPGRRQGLTAIVGGGIQKSPASLQRLANVLDLPLIACDEPETSLRGAAVMAIERLGKRAAIISGRTIHPHAAAAKAYRTSRRALAALEAQIFPC